MTDDLVTRLRYGTEQRNDTSLRELCLESADEIERLRACKPLPEGDALIDELKQEILRLLRHIDHLEFIIKDIERLRAVVQAGVDMRHRQKAYFKTRSKEALIASKQAEAAFDKAAEEGK